MTTTNEEEIDLTGITHNEGTPTLISVTKVMIEIGRQLQHRACCRSSSIVGTKSKDRYQFYSVWKQTDWLKKK